MTAIGPATPPVAPSGIPASSAGDALPTLAEMADTLAFMWRHFLEELAAARAANPAGGVVDREWGGAQVRFRLEKLADPGFVLLLNVRGGEPAFHLNGSLVLDNKGEPAPDGVVWHAGGDHEELVAWMVPWVSLHVERGGGWIDF